MLARNTISYRCLLVKLGITLTLSMLGVLHFSSGFAQSYEQKVVSIYFPSDVDELGPKSKSTIRACFLELNEYLIKEVYVEGHTDSDASLTYNASLAARRASNTQDFLISQGLRPAMIRLESFGETKPNSTSKAKNRRVQITIVYETNAFDENLIVKQGEVKVIKISTFHGGTRQPLACSYVIEKNKRNQFANTGARAVCYFDRRKYGNLNITFSAHGFLNENIALSDKDIKDVGDTLHLKVYLKPVEVIQKLRFDHIFFYTDTDNFKPESKPELEKLVKMLKEFPSLYVEIQGHMNFAENRQANIFQRIYNHDLSHKRARAVYDYLISRGINQKRLTYKGLSNFRMIYPNPQTAEEADQNKRVEVWTLQLVAEK